MKLEDIFMYLLWNPGALVERNHVHCAGLSKGLLFSLPVIGIMLQPL